MAETHTVISGIPVYDKDGSFFGKAFAYSNGEIVVEYLDGPMPVIHQPEFPMLRDAETYPDQIEAIEVFLSPRQLVFAL